MCIAAGLRFLIIISANVLLPMQWTLDLLIYTDVLYTRTVSTYSPGPRASRLLYVYIDDLNMPKINVYNGTFCCTFIGVCAIESSASVHNATLTMLVYDTGKAKLMK